MATVNYFDWNMGVTDDTLHKGIIKNTNYIAGSGLKKYFSGSKDYVSTIEGQIDTRKFCNLMVKGDWVSLIPMISIIKKEDIFQLRNCILGYLKAVLLNTNSVVFVFAVLSVTPLQAGNAPTPQAKLYLSFSIETLVTALLTTVTSTFSFLSALKKL